MASHAQNPSTRLICTPEDFFIPDPTAPNEIPVDALLAAVSRSHALTALLMAQYSGHIDQCNDTITVNALWLLQGQLEQMQQMIRPRQIQAVQHG